MKKLLWIPMLMLIVLAGCSVGQEIDGLDFASNSKLTNINPDPNGEPWIAGGLEMPADEVLNAIPIQSFGGSIMVGELPAFVDNTLEKEFRPIFSQYGGSCAQATGIGYIYTYEINVLRDADASLTANQYASGYTWNAVNGGKNQGSWMSTGWDIVKLNGIPNVDVYAGNRNGGQQYSDYSKFMTGYDMYYAGMTNGLDNQFTMYTKTAADIEVVKQWIYDHARAEFPGGIVSFACSITGAKYATLTSDSSQSGKTVLTKMGNTGGHGMTIAGYDDNITYDYNGDGQITTDIDINDDGVVDLKDSERGAVLVVNSWGSYWKNSGKVWMMYKVLADTSSDGGIWSQRVYAINVKDNPRPTLTARVKIKHNGRGSVQITLGIATNVNATSPTKTKVYTRLVQSSGYSNMISWSDTDAIEMGLDMTELAEGIDLSQPVKFFLQVYENDYSSRYNGVIEEFVVMDYSGASVKEYYSAQFDVTMINKSTTTLTAINDDTPVSKYDQVYFRGTANDWATTSMTLISNFTWQTVAHFDGEATDRFKFDIDGDWSLNFGDNEADGIAEPFGADIYVTDSANDYMILFNDRTKVYTVTLDGVAAPENLTYILKDTNMVMLSWDVVAGADGYIVSREPSNGFAAYATSKNQNFYGGRCEPGETYVYSVKAYTGIPFPQKYSAPTTVNVAHGGWAKVYDQVTIRGTFNNWNTTAMTLVADNTWEAPAVFGNTSEERFKFDINGDWSLNFGDNDNDGIADQNGNDITVDANASMTIRFNDLTKAYSLVTETGNIETTPVGGNAPTVELLGMDVQLIKDGNVVATKPFVLDGSSYISAYFPDYSFGTYTLKVDTTKNGAHYSGEATVTVDSTHTEYVNLVITKTVQITKVIHYYTGWSATYIHYQKDDSSWTAAPGLAMACGDNGWCDIEIADENEMTFCFNDGNGNWDSSFGSNYSSTISEIWIKNGQQYAYNPDA